ncbi:MAG: tetratricopeptide repeat protein, partial [Bacteroidota bacterium]
MKQHHKSYDTLRIRFTYCYRVFLWLAVILSPPSLLAQGGNKTAAEYWETYHRTDDDSTQVKLLSQLVTAYIRINPDSALLLAETAYERATTMGNEHLQAHAYVSLGKAYKRKRKVLDALSNFDQGLAIFQEQKDEEGIHRVYLERASVYMASGNPEAAIEDLNKHLTYTLQTDNDLKRAGTYHNLGKAYRQLNEPYQALENYLLARNLKDSLANVGHPEMTSREQFSTYQNLAAFYQELEQFNKARETLRQGLEFLPQEETRTYIIGLYTLGGLEERDSNYVEAQQLYQQCLEMAQASKNSVLLPYIYDGLGTVSRMQDQREIASTYYQQAFDMLGDMNNPPVLSNVLNNQARLLLDAGQTRAAKEKAKVAYTTAKASGLQVQYIDGAKLLAEIYQTEGRYQEANFYWQEYIEASETKATEGRKQE